ncbi:hypothetical protein [Candidatus Vampirococcus lugosii]|uniref:Uncharacterized protein n=1 Tax=Candidatus Vampirococcus lugosii TaxID=2789015 RepID=A0ABS5QKP1_9BACT|nr:hypothetical protein [Candidatus Vampirococcus lugosii]MBS8121584.1 hypothetical protein [Candidatus Vampirococcus lugosii]
MYNASGTIENFILVIMAIVVIILFAGAVYAFLVSIFQFIFSKGDAEKIKKAWNNIRYMILGIILSFLLLFVFPIVFERLKIPGYEVYTAQNIFNKSGELIRNIMGKDESDNFDYDTRSNTRL